MDSKMLVMPSKKNPMDLVDWPTTWFISFAILSLIAWQFLFPKGAC